MIHCLLVLGWSAQAQPPQLEITPTAGGLGQAALTLAGRHGVRVTYEGVPRLEGIAWRMERQADGTDAFRLISPNLRAEYAASATPREAAEALVAAYNALDADAHYRVLEQGGVLHLVPTEARTPDGRYEPFSSLMDTPLTLGRVTGEPTHLHRDLLASLVRAAGVPIQDAHVEFVVGELLPETTFDRIQADVTLPSATGTARELFDDLLRVSGGLEAGWQLIWVGNGWSFGYTAVDVDDELRFNATPLTPAKPPAP